MLQNSKRAIASRGQYFSFDAIVATVIMVIAISSLLAYWIGVQSVVDSRASPLYSDAMRIADSIISPGQPQDWPSSLPAGGGIGNGVYQLGLSSGFSNRLNRTKLNAAVERVGSITGPLDAKYSAYLEAGRIMRAPSDYYILVESADPGINICSTGVNCIIGWAPPPNAREVAIAYRGAVSEEGFPVRVRVFLWRK